MARSRVLFTQTKVGVSALSVERATGLNYSTAWTLLQKLRAVVAQDGRPKLDGDVEVDETYVGGVQEGLKGREKGDNEIVIVACEVLPGDKTGRIRLGRRRTCRRWRWRGSSKPTSRPAPNS